MNGGLKKCRIIQYNVPKRLELARINVLRIHFHHTGLLLLKFFLNVVFFQTFKIFIFYILKLDGGN